MKKKTKMPAGNKASKTKSFADLVPTTKRGGPKTSPMKGRKNASGKMKMSEVRERLKDKTF